MSLCPVERTEPQSAADDGDGPASETPTVEPITGIGGNLSVTGDREGTLTVTRESNDGKYSLVGDGARVVFEGSRPPVVSQVSWDGLEFFPEPDACTVTPGELDDEIGVGYAEVHCEDLADIRGGETVSMAGTLGLALTTVGESDLPQMGGSVTVGEETWEFEEAFLFEFRREPGGRDRGLQHGPDRPRTRLTPIPLRRPDPPADAGQRRTRRRGRRPGAGACSLETNELGRLAPGTAVVELSIDCPVADVPGLGPVAIRGTPIVQQIENLP